MSLEPFPRRPAPLQPGSQARDARGGFMSIQAGLVPDTERPGLRHQGGAQVLWGDHTGRLPSITSMEAPHSLKRGRL